MQQTNAVAPGEILRHASSLHKKTKQSRGATSKMLGYTSSSAHSTTAEKDNKSVSHVHFSGTTTGDGHPYQSGYASSTPYTHGHPTHGTGISSESPFASSYSPVPVEVGDSFRQMQIQSKYEALYGNQHQHPQRGCNGYASDGSMGMSMNSNGVSVVPAGTGAGEGAGRLPFEGVPEGQLSPAQQGKKQQAVKLKLDQVRQLQNKQRHRGSFCHRSLLC